MRIRLKPDSLQNRKKETPLGVYFILVRLTRLELAQLKIATTTSR